MTITETTTTDRPCPSWCTPPKNHDFGILDAQTGVRDHSRALSTVTGRELLSDDDLDMHVEVVQTEQVGLAGMVTDPDSGVVLDVDYVGPSSWRQPRICFSGPNEAVTFDKAQAKALAAALLQAADELDAMENSIPHSERVAYAVRAKMDAADISVGDLSRQTDIPRATLQRRLNRVTPFTVTEVEAIARALDAPVTDLLVPRAAS